MKGLDTNVLVRYLTEDDPVQARRAAAWIATAVARGDRCFISPVVLCELAWVLRGAYRISKADLLETLDRLLATTQFVIGEKDVIRAAVEAYRTGQADFADYVIGTSHRDAGCDRTATFDRRLRAVATFQVL
ncbi:MAG TPA: type II toxin-antitoxin system VapC family toxin [Vicinamibacterales bacterium]|nr:type II toxin-antitoxin system VapC family toxin [Vicinamibacterales bacterium]